MLQKIKEVRLENNPLICDRCHMGSLIQIAKSVGIFTTQFFVCYHNILFQLGCFCSFHILQLQWSIHPICFLPESLRGIRISDLNIGSLEVCTAAESLHDETFDAASTSHNFLTRGKIHFHLQSFYFSYAIHNHYFE